MILAIDVGTTNLKAAVLDASGSAVAHTQRELPLSGSEPGAAEHGALNFRALLVEACREVISRSPDAIKLVVLSSYQMGLMIADQNLAPKTGMLTLVDTRARGSMAELRERFPPEEIYRRAGSPPFLQAPLAKLFYLRNARPELFADGAMVLDSKSYLLSILCGAAVTDTGIASATEFYDIHRLQWNRELLGQLGVAAESLPEVVDGTKHRLPMLDTIADELGLPRAVPVLTGVYDGGAVGIGLGAMQSGIAVSNVGTSGMMRALFSSAALDPTPAMRTQAYVLMPGGYFIGAALNNAALTLRWLKERVFGRDYQELTAALETTPPGADGLLFLPYLSGEREWKRGETMSAGFFGLREAHGAAHMIRAVYEGVVFSFCEVMHTLRENGITVDALRLGGGGARITPWVQIFADVLGVPIRVSNSKDDALMGNAILGMTALGEFRSLNEASQAMLSLGSAIEPRSALRAVYQDAYGKFARMKAALL